MVVGWIPWRRIGLDAGEVHTATLREKEKKYFRIFNVIFLKYGFSCCQGVAMRQLTYYRWLSRCCYVVDRMIGCSRWLLGYCVRCSLWFLAYFVMQLLSCSPGWLSMHSYTVNNML